ncbi:MAG: VWA domain-containing protein [Actinobacteria bacterium]|nr:VWA domain-containing protein [Actinomycetota bacterium]
MHLTFLTPWGGVIAVGAALPLGALALSETRARKARRALRLAEPSVRTKLAPALMLALVPALLGLAVSQPILQSVRKARLRSDAQIFYVFDTSESMRASAGPHASTRLSRAVAIARRMHLAIEDVPSGLATMTDRVLPNVFPTGSEQLFTAALEQTIGIDRPPPKGLDQRATTFAALDTFAGSNFFSEGTQHRLVVLLTDGETAPYFTGDLREALRGKPHTRFVIVRVGHPRDRIFIRGRLDRGYRADSSAARATKNLAAVVGGSAYAEGNVGTAISEAKRVLGKGPLVGVGEGLHVVALAPWLALLSLVPLAALLWRRNIVR